MSGDEQRSYKDELRREFRAHRAAMDAHEHARASAELAGFLAPLLEEVRRIAVYASTQNEISVDALATLLRERGVETYYPRVISAGEMVFARVASEADLVPGKFGIREPDREAPVRAIHELDVVLVPAVAFDVRGARIGFGGGYYDRALESASPGAPRLIGVGYDWQIHDEPIPDEPHDVRVDLVVTDARVVDCD